MLYLAIWIIIINVIGYFLMAEDKAASKEKRRRIKEETILACATIGGFVGVYVGMQHCRHKTKKFGFQAKLFLTFLLYIAVGIAYVLFWP